MACIEGSTFVEVDNRESLFAFQGKPTMKGDSKVGERLATANKILEDLFERIIETEQQILNLRIIKDLSVADTAKGLQCSPGKVRVDTHRAHRIRESLATAAL